MQLWERSDALAALAGALRGAGRVALLPGEAGIGKSALVRAFADGPAAHARVLWGGCDPLLTPRASGPLRDIARQAGGALAERVAGGAPPAEVYAALLDELAGPGARPRRVVVIEDAHWADEATLDLLVFLGRRIAGLSALLVVTYRDDELAPEHPLRAALAALPRETVLPVPVRPLSRACVAGQAARVGRDPDELYALTGGNPLLVTELVAAGELAVPPTVSDLMLARVAGLSRPARDVAHLVSVLPTGAEAALLAGIDAVGIDAVGIDAVGMAPAGIDAVGIHAAGIDAAGIDAVEEALAAGVLVARPDGVGYRHELLRRAVEDALSPARRRALHRRALTLLTALDEVDPARLVHHARHAGDAAALLRHGLVAGAGAAAHGAHREAVAHYRAALTHAARLPAAERAAALEAYAIEAYLAGVAADGIGALEAALAEREALDDTAAAGEDLRWLSRLAWWSGRGGPARAAAARAVEVLEPAGPSRGLAMAYSNRSQLHMLAHEPDAAIDWGERAGVLADRVGDLDTSVHAATNVATARLLAGDLAATAELRRAHETADRAGLIDHAARALVNLATSLLELAQFAAAAQAVDTAYAYAMAHDLDGYAQYLLGVRAGVRLEQCEWDAAIGDAEAALGRPTRTGVAVVPALVARGRILAARGDPAALSILDGVAAGADGTGELQRIGPVAAARAEYFLLQGEPERAAAEARAALDLARAKGHAWLAGELAYRVWRATGAAPPLALPEPYRLAIAGDWAGAAAAWAALGRGYARLQALALGDRSAVAQALGALTRLGAVRAARRVRQDARGRGVAVPPEPRGVGRTNPAGLTQRQLDVLRLLADGLTNVDIGLRLSLSPKTVEHHISAILGKLAASTRGQAVAAARRLHLLG